MTALFVAQWLYMITMFVSLYGAVQENRRAKQ